MKMLLKIVVALVLILVTNGLLSDYYLRYGVSRSAVLALDEAPGAYPNPISTLFVGDSHMGRSVDPRIFGPDAYSLWSPGQCYVRSYYRLEAFLDETDPPLDRLVITVGLHSFREWRLRAITKPPWPKYIRYWEVGEAFDRPARFAWHRTRAAFIPYAGNFEDYFLKREENTTVADVVALQGGLPYPQIMPPAEWTAEMATASLDAQFPTGPQPISEGYTIYLGRIVELLRARGTEVVLITAPVTRVYWEEAGAYVSYDVFYATIAAQSGVTYFDYHDLLFDRPELFRDVDHLNEEGSEVFSEQLKADLTGQ